MHTAQSAAFHELIAIPDLKTPALEVDFSLLEWFASLDM